MAGIWGLWVQTSRQSLPQIAAKNAKNIPVRLKSMLLIVNFATYNETFIPKGKSPFTYYFQLSIFWWMIEFLVLITYIHYFFMHLDFHLIVYKGLLHLFRQKISFSCSKKKHLIWKIWMFRSLSWPVEPESS